MTAASIQTECTVGIEPQPAVMTFGLLVREHVLPHVRATLISHAEIECMMRLRILPAFGSMCLDGIRPPHVAQFRKKLVDEGLSASRVNAHLAALRRAFNLALRWQLFDGRNPAAAPGMLRTEGRESFLLAPQLQALIAALEVDADRLSASAIALLALTGARKSEILKADWKHVDLNRSTLTVPRSKSGKRRLIYLSDQAMRVLQRLPRTPGQTLIFPSPRRAGQALSGLRGVWTRAKARAGLPDGLRLHDLRHTFASLLINDGVPLYDLGKLLGHKQVSTTARYAHLRDDRQLDAVNSVGRIADGISPLKRTAPAPDDVPVDGDAAAGRRAKMGQAVAAVAARLAAERGQAKDKASALVAATGEQILQAITTDS